MKSLFAIGVVVVVVVGAIFVFAMNPLSNTIIHPESTAPDEVAASIETIVFEWADKFNRGDWVKNQDTWDADEIQPMYLGEERDRWVIGKEGLNSYFNPPAIARMLMESVVIVPYRLRVRLASEKIAIATWDNRLDFKVRTRPAIQDDYRVNAFFRRTDDGWKFIHYAEHAMGAMTYLEHLYRKTVTPGFPENARPYDKDWTLPEHLKGKMPEGMQEKQG